MIFTDLIKTISFDTFAELITVSPRKVRESLYSHYGVKNKGKGLLSSLKDKKETRIKRLHQALEGATSEREQEFLKELIRNWLMTKRPLLKATLDHLGVKNDNGLVDEEPDFFKKLKPAQVKELISVLEKDFPKDEVLIYLTFMEVPNIKKYF